MTREERAALDRERWKLDGKGDHVAAKPPSDAYRDGWERVFGGREAFRKVIADRIDAHNEYVEGLYRTLASDIEEIQTHGRR